MFMKIEFKILEKESKKGNKYKGLYVVVDGVENFVCFVK